MAVWVKARMQLLKPRGLILLLCGMLGLLIGLGSYTFYYAQGYSYLSDDPRACVNCHIMREQYDGWQKSSHHAVATCNSCHVPHGVHSEVPHQGREWLLALLRLYVPEFS